MERRSISDILNIKLKLYDNVNAKNGVEMILSDILLKPHKLNVIERFRRKVIGMTYGEKKQLKAGMLSRLPCFTPTGLFGESKSVSELVEYSNIISIDIDPMNDKGEGNTMETMEKVPEILIHNPFVFYFNKSLSNKGYYALFVVDGTIEDYYTHYQALKDDFKLLGIELDKNAIKLTQPRFLTLPEEGVLKDSFEVYTKKCPVALKRIEEPQKSNFKRETLVGRVADENSLKKLETIVSVVEKEKLNIAFDHKANFEMRCVIKNIVGAGDAGLELYSRIMNQRRDYTNAEVIEKWKANEEYGNFTIGTAYYHLEEARRRKIVKELNKRLLKGDTNYQGYQNCV